MSINLKQINGKEIIDFLNDGLYEKKNTPIKEFSLKLDFETSNTERYIVRFSAIYNDKSIPENEILIYSDGRRIVCELDHSIDDETTIEVIEDLVADWLKMNIKLSTKQFKLDVDKIKTIEDVKSILEHLDLHFIPPSKEVYEEIKHLLKEI